MKGLSIAVAASFLLFTSSCSLAEETEDLEINEDVKQVVFFSDESNDANEAPYYDAIIELKEDFPDTMQNMVILTPDKADPYYKVFGIDKGPAILILYNDQVSVKVYGQATKEQIIMRIAKELSNDSKRPPH